MPAHLELLQDEPVSASDDEDLTHDQIHALLKDAEIRIRERNSNALTLDGKDQSFKRLPKLNAGSVEQPYIRNDGDVARIDHSRLLPVEQRKLANGFRKIEDPIALKKKASKVLSLFLYALLCSP